MFAVEELSRPTNADGVLSIYLSCWDIL